MYCLFIFAAPIKYCDEFGATSVGLANLAESCPRVDTPADLDKPEFVLNYVEVLVDWISHRGSVASRSIDPPKSVVADYQFSPATLNVIC